MSIPLALGTLSFFLAVIWGAPLIRWLRDHRIGKQIRVEEPETHQIKTGTPTMGGVMVLIPVIVVTVVLNIYNLLAITTSGSLTGVTGRSILIPLFTIVGFGILGGVDDWTGIRGEGNGIGLLG